MKGYIEYNIWYEWVKVMKRQEIQNDHGPCCPHAIVALLHEYGSWILISIISQLHVVNLLCILRAYL